ncbi:MAG: HAD-IIB family hydrolase [Candidatus Binatia bacterium]
MRYLALATDYDGTLAHRGAVSAQTLEALQRLVDSGRKLVMVTGRTLEDLQQVFAQVELFHRIVAENGAVLYDPKSKLETVLCEPASARLADRLRQRGVQPLAVGRAIVATWTPHEIAVLETIKELELELHVIFNKGAVMVLPSSVNKATGLEAALAELELSPHNVAGIGDAENDHAFLAMCECSAAVANALEMVKQKVDFVTPAERGEGVCQWIEQMLEDDLAVLEPRLKRHDILLGQRMDGDVREDVSVPNHGDAVLISGPSQSGKSTVTMGLIERICEQEYQFCLIDPEGDYRSFAGAVSLGDATHPPGIDAVMQLLADPTRSATVNLLSVPLADRPLFFGGLLARLLELRLRRGRPHWLIVDEAHHLLPSSWVPASAAMPSELKGLVLITNCPDKIAAPVLERVQTLVALGKEPMEVIHAFAAAARTALPFDRLGFDLEPGEAAIWLRSDAAPIRVRPTPGTVDRRRHTRKYAEGELPPDRSFYFRGPRNKMKLRAYNLQLFAEMAEGVDDETWEHHRQSGDYSSWFRNYIKDEDLTREAEAVEAAELPPEQSRALLLDAIHRRYGATT